MKRYLLYLLAVSFSMAYAQPKPPAPFGATPTERQLEWQKLRSYAFTHFGPNTFTDLEWGHGTESEEIFSPTSLDCEQWAKTFKKAGLEGIIITAKHHDGFCLWPSKYSTHTVRESKWRDGKGDVLRELSDACQKYGLKFGVYLSPWDRNHPKYGTPEYNDVFVNMLDEVLTQYGTVSEVWFDGACGEGPNGKRQVYDFPRFEAVVRKLQPNAVIFSDVGPDIRWVGNEQGFAGETNWSTINNEGWYAGIPDKNAELQSGHENGKTYQPTEVDVSIRPGWFYHKNEDEKVKSTEKLTEIYLSSVGRNANLLLNVPPDPSGRINQHDIDALLAWKKNLDKLFKKNLALTAKSIVATNTRANALQFDGHNLIDSDLNTYWATDDVIKNASIELDFGKKRKVSLLLLQEHSALGQRVKSFSVEGFDGQKWVALSRGTTIGYRRIVAFPAVKLTKIRINVLDALACPVLSNLEVY